jgi:hypothetical protein
MFGRGDDARVADRRDPIDLPNHLRIQGIAKGDLALNVRGEEQPVRTVETLGQAFRTDWSQSQ